MFIDDEGFMVGNGGANIIFNDCEYQDIHFLSDDKIDKDDWFYCFGGLNMEKGIHKSTTYYFKHLDDCKKIVCSTDKNLRLTSPSDDFIQRYIKSYNKKKPITEVSLNIILKCYYSSSVYDAVCSECKVYVDCDSIQNPHIRKHLAPGQRNIKVKSSYWD